MKISRQKSRDQITIKMDVSEFQKLRNLLIVGLSEIEKIEVSEFAKIKFPDGIISDSAKEIAREVIQSF